MQRINYDFSKLEDCMSAVKQNPSNQNLNSLKNELNRFWKDKQCREIIYTVNLDKIFFGMCVIPYVNDDMTKKILTTDDKVVANTYYLEIDSKLFDLQLTTKELVAVLLHEVGHVVNNGEAVDAIRASMDTYYTSTGKPLASLTYDARRIIRFGIVQAIRKFNDIFDVNTEEYIADEFVVRCGYGPDLESAVRKIVRNTGTIIRQVDNKFIALQWAIRVYTELKYRRINTIRALNNLMNFTGSELEERELLQLKRAISDKDMIYEGRMVNESFIDKILDKASGAYKAFKSKGMRGLEDDLYEYSMRIENVDDEDESLIILRGLNLRITMIDDYVLEMGKHLNDTEKDKWFALRGKYVILRDKLAAKKTYKDKYYGLFVKTPVVSSRYEA